METTHRSRLVPAVLTVVVVGLVALWVYALAFAPRGSPNRLDEEAWAHAAEDSCAVTREQILALPGAGDFADIHPREEALRQRAEVGDRATDLLEGMVDRLQALPAPSSDRDRTFVTGWLDDYRTYLQNRRDHIERWRSGENPPFSESQTEDGVPISLRMDEFARLNDMRSCRVPADFG